MVDDGLFRQVFTWQAGLGWLVCKRDQAGRELILERNAALRREEGTLRDLTFARQIASIPLDDWAVLIAKYPDLDSRDAATKRRALVAFLQSPEGEPYRVRGKI
jgi:hypothetical protein